MATKRRPLTKSESMARVRRENTAPEVTLRKALWRAGVRYRLHAPLPGRPDIVIGRAKLAVFVDGCFWHGCPTHYTAPANNAEFWRTKLLENRSRDARVDQKLAERGYRVARVWEHEVKSALADVVARLVDLAG